VITIVKNKLNLTSDNEFKVILPALEAWINEEMENTTSLLDPQKVAEEFLRENDYSDEYDSPPSQPEYEYVAPSSAQASSASSVQVSSPPASSSSSASPPPVSPNPASPPPVSSSSSSASFAPASYSSASFASSAPTPRTPARTPARTHARTPARYARTRTDVKPSILAYNDE